MNFQKKYLLVKSYPVWEIRITSAFEKPNGWEFRSIWGDVHMSSTFFRFQIDCSLTENHYLLTIWYNDYGNHQTRAIFYAEVRLNETYDKHLPVMRNEFVCQKYGFSAGSINVGPLGYYPKTLRISDCDGLPIVIRIADLIRDIVA